MFLENQNIDTPCCIQFTVWSKIGTSWKLGISEETITKSL